MEKIFLTSCICFILFTACNQEIEVNSPEVRNHPPKALIGNYNTKNWVEMEVLINNDSVYLGIWLDPKSGRKYLYEKSPELVAQRKKWLERLDSGLIDTNQIKLKYKLMHDKYAAGEDLKSTTIYLEDCEPFVCKKEEVSCSHCGSDVAQGSMYFWPEAYWGCVTPHRIDDAPTYGGGAICTSCNQEYYANWTQTIQNNSLFYLPDDDFNAPDGSNYPIFRTWIFVNMDGKTSVDLYVQNGAFNTTVPDVVYITTSGY